MDDLELEEDLNLDDETAADAPELDDAMRAILMRLGTDAVAASRGGTMVSGMPSNTITYAAEPAAPSGGDLESSTNALVREKILARVGAKVAAPTPQLPTKAADPEWQIGDACDAVYLEDDQFYGALIVDGPDDKGQYLVVFTECERERACIACVLTFCADTAMSSGPAPSCCASRQARWGFRWTTWLARAITPRPRRRFTRTLSKLTTLSRSLRRQTIERTVFVVCFLTLEHHLVSASKYFLAASSRRDWSRRSRSDTRMATTANVELELTSK